MSILPIWPKLVFFFERGMERMALGESVDGACHRLLWKQNSFWLVGILTLVKSSCVSEGWGGYEEGYPRLPLALTSLITSKYYGLFIWWTNNLNPSFYPWWNREIQGINQLSKIIKLVAAVEKNHTFFYLVQCVSYHCFSFVCLLLLHNLSQGNHNCGCTEFYLFILVVLHIENPLFSKRNSPNYYFWDFLKRYRNMMWANEVSRRARPNSIHLYCDSWNIWTFYDFKLHLWFLFTMFRFVIFLFLVRLVAIFCY